MKFPVRILLALLLALNAVSLRAADDPLAWPPITSQTKPWAYNWWMGSAVDKTNITRELQRYHDGGLGGITSSRFTARKVLRTNTSIIFHRNGWR